MLGTITMPISFFILLSLFFVGAIGSLLLRKDDSAANIWSSFFAIAGSLWGLLFSVAIIISEHTLVFVIDNAPLSLLSLSFNIDLLSAFFIFVISLIALFTSVYAIGYVRHYYQKYNIGDLGFFYNFFILGILLVLTASNGIFFLIGWEIMSVASFFGVIYDRNNQENIKAGFLYLVMTYIGTAFITVAFLLLYKFIGSFDFATIKSGVGLLPIGVKNIIFFAALIGFGFKAGIIPLHTWLPAAHPAAPSHISALMSGVMIKTGIFMMIRLFLDILQPIPIWWGVVVLIIGMTSSLLGVLYALTEHDIKRLLAYHSIENIGIILLGLGSALIFSSLGMPALVLLSLVAALFHTLNHAIFKSLLFLGAGSVINQMHTRNMEEYGGLIKYMPQTAFFFLIGSMAISALPPFNGFFSEWLTYQALFQGIAMLGSSIRWLFILAVSVLAFTGGLALACFVKAFGSIFLARPRSMEVAHAKESPRSMLIGMGALAMLSFLFGIFSSQTVSLLEKIGRSFDMLKKIPETILAPNNQSLMIKNGFASVSSLTFLLSLVVAFIFVTVIINLIINRRQKIKIGATWNCGTDLTPRMEITSTGFARSIILIFKGILKPSIQHTIDYSDSESRYLPKTRTVSLGVGDVYKSYLYQPITTMITGLSLRVKNIHSGNTNIYVLYILIALLVSLFSIL